MKKFSTISFAVFLLITVLCLGSCFGISGKKLDGETNEYRWELNTKSHTLTIEGKDPEDKPDLAPGPWQLAEAQEIEHVVLKGKEPLYFVPEQHLDKLLSLKKTYFREQ